MKSFQEFMFIAEAAYDASVMGSSQIRRVGDGGRVGAERKKTAPERRRTKRVGGGQTVPAKEYKPRKDIGSQRGSQTQAPTQERGSARETQLAAAKEERRKAAQARIAAKKKGETVAKAPKPTESELKAQAKQLTAKKKKETPQREKQVKTVKGEYTRAEKRQLKRAGRRTLRDIVLKATGKKKESQLKHKYTGTGDEGGKD